MNEHRQDFDNYDSNKDGMIDAMEIREHLPNVTDEEVSSLPSRPYATSIG